MRTAVAAVSDVGGTPAVRAGNGGLDANWMVRHGVPTVTFGTGQNEVHTVDEWINRDEYERACALAVRLATNGSRLSVSPRSNFRISAVPPLLLMSAQASAALSSSLCHVITT